MEDGQGHQNRQGNGVTGALFVSDKSGEPKDRRRCRLSELTGCAHQQERGCLTVQYITLPGPPATRTLCPLGMRSVGGQDV